MKHAYAAGVKAAFEQFGVRVASELFGQRMPSGPDHLGAEWLTKALEGHVDDHQPVGTAASHRPLEKPPMWGPRASLEATTGLGSNSPGMGRYGGV